MNAAKENFEPIPEDEKTKQDQADFQSNDQKKVRNSLKNQLLQNLIYFTDCEKFTSRHIGTTG